MILFLDNLNYRNRFDYIYPELHFNVGYDEIRFEGVMNALPDKTPYIDLPASVIEKALRELIKESTSASTSTSKNPYMCDFVQSMVWETVPTFFWANDEKNLEECVRQYKWKIKFSNSLHNVLRKLSIDTEANPSLMERLGKLKSEEKVLSETMMTEGDPESLVVIESLKNEILEMVLRQENVVSGTFVADLREIAKFVHEQLSTAVNADAIEQGIRSACLEKFSSYEYLASKEYFLIRRADLLQSKRRLEKECSIVLQDPDLSLLFNVHLLAMKICSANKIVEYIETIAQLRYVEEKLSQSHQDNHESGDRGNSCEAITSTSPEEEFCPNDSDSHDATSSTDNERFKMSAETWCLNYGEKILGKNCPKEDMQLLKEHVKKIRKLFEEEYPDPESITGPTSSSVRPKILRRFVYGIPTKNGDAYDWTLRNERRKIDVTLLNAEMLGKLFEFPIEPTLVSKLRRKHRDYTFYQDN